MRRGNGWMWRGKGRGRMGRLMRCCSCWVGDGRFWLRRDERDEARRRRRGKVSSRSRFRETKIAREAERLTLLPTLSNLPPLPLPLRLRTLHLHSNLYISRPLREFRIHDGSPNVFWNGASCDLEVYELRINVGEGFDVGQDEGESFLEE